MARTRLLLTAVALAATAVVGWAPAASSAGTALAHVTAGARGVSAASPGALAHVTAAAYRYWTFWVGTDGGWSFATAGPASLVPEDGAVQGWRFAVTTQAGTASSQPRTAASFADICAGTPTEAGRKRVALVIDAGEPGEAPAGQQPQPQSATCVVADLDATGYQVLRSVAAVRVEGGLVCAIDGYPTGECAPVVDDPVPAPSGSASERPVGSPIPSSTAIGAGSAMDTASSDDDAGSGTPWALLGVLAAVAAVAGVLVWRRPRD